MSENVQNLRHPFYKDVSNIKLFHFPSSKKKHIHGILLAMETPKILYEKSVNLNKFLYLLIGNKCSQAVFLKICFVGVYNCFGGKILLLVCWIIYEKFPEKNIIRIK